MRDDRKARRSGCLDYVLVLLVAVALVMASWVAVGVFSGSQVSSIGIAITALATVFVAVFAGWTLLSNAELIKSSQDEVDAALKLVEQSEKDRAERRAALELRFENRFPMWWPEQNWVRVEVANTGPAMAGNVTVILEEIRPVNPMSSRGAEHNVLPSRLGWKGHKEDHCDINPASREYFDVLKFLPAAERDGHAQIGFTTHESMDVLGGTIAIYDLRHNYEYVLTIVATAANAAPMKRPFTMRTNANGTALTFEAGHGSLSWQDDPPS